jgi:tellurite resistance protein
MAQKLMAFYEQAKAKGSIKAQMRLAMLTGLPSTKAVNEPDSPELIAKFEAAMREIEKEFK